jgi:hypothetical protein
VQRTAIAAERTALAAERTALDTARRAVREELARADAVRAELESHEQVTAEPVVESDDTPAAAPAPPPAVAPSPLVVPPAAAAALDLDLDRGPLAGAGLCYGEPVTAAGRTVLPVARVRGGAGGGFDARPLGFVEVTADGARFRRVPGTDGLARAGAAAAVVLAGAAALAALRARR